MNGYRVLVVEDDVMTQSALCRLLSHRGLLVSVAETLMEGLAALEERPHCIILDLMLPDGDGADILRKVREDEWPCRVAVCTGSNDPVRMALVKGMDPVGMFRKPVNLDDLLGVLGEETVA